MIIGITSLNLKLNREGSLLITLIFSLISSIHYLGRVKSCPNSLEQMPDDLDDSADDGHHQLVHGPRHDWTHHVHHALHATGVPGSHQLLVLVLEASVEAQHVKHGADHNLRPIVAGPSQVLEVGLLLHPSHIEELQCAAKALLSDVHCLLFRVGEQCQERAPGLGILLSAAVRRRNIYSGLVQSRARADMAGRGRCDVTKGTSMNQSKHWGSQRRVPGQRDTKYTECISNYLASVGYGREDGDDEECMMKFHNNHDSCSQHKMVLASEARTLWPCRAGNEVEKTSSSVAVPCAEAHSTFNWIGPLPEQKVTTTGGWKEKALLKANINRCNF